MINLSVIPKEPGCYIYRDIEKNIIYVGKAKNLKKRISSYFSKKNHDTKTQNLVKSIFDIEFIVTNNEIEALLLESILIKKHSPKYNIDLKDSKNYAYIYISEENFPRIGISRNKSEKGKFYGPFISAKERDYVLDILKKTFKIRSCKNMQKRPCLRHHIKNCTAPCTGNIASKKYLDQIKKAEYILKGNIESLISKLKDEMIIKSKNLQFEEAILIREEISAIENLKTKQNINRQKNYDEDIIAYIEKDGNIHIIVFNVLKGTLYDKKYFKFEYVENFFEEFLIQYYSENRPPSEIIISGFPKDFEDFSKEYNPNALLEFLSKKRESKVSFKVPKKGEKKELLNLAMKNLEILVLGNDLKVEALKNKLMLENPPKVIECFDISHLSGNFTVASMVQFRDGKADKKNYRRYKIKTVTGIDDFKSISEVVFRRYSKLLKENSKMPDLIIIDGGKGQLSSAFYELKKLNLKIPVVSIAKREEEIYAPGTENALPITKNEKASLFIQEIRDEAHRFAITYNKLLRKKDLIK
ncbi:excinuclease ABC, C subunit [Methanococcus vannielii SB]|uniref:UvrABC system protein C n=1 Tax=Methanococcus vannielii (strain ATCC 35089 / DSM 1224 / JCM 13029 / OCM 148 / SB) TaxID=406327 RepID=A6USM0_METVS|nr:excinuclease ABC subunit UvrC [Methanococcus vannielii]ABR55492.1 excinuclease ABC, C subunit [Methanococcus vannielii SB]